MLRHASPGMRVTVLVCLVVVVGCDQARISPAASTPTSLSTPTDATATPASVSPGVSGSAGAASSGPLLGDGLPACGSDPTWRCLVVDVAVDDTDASKGTIPVHAYIRAHLDRRLPPLEPVLVTPGGPGGSIWVDPSVLPLASWQERHDTVLVDTRGVGESAKIDCPALQGEVPDLAGLRAAIRACALSLGPNVDRYGSADVVRDVEAVRDTLAIPSFDYYGASYATVTEQAYASRHPDRIHALVLDSGFPMKGDHVTADDFIGVGAPKAVLRAIGLVCARDAPCAGAHAAPVDELTALARDLRARPLHAKDALGRPVTVDETTLISMMLGLGYDPRMDTRALLNAATAYAKGDRDPLVASAEAHPIFPIPATDLSDFSMGDNAAAGCVDTPAPWEASDAPAVRLSKLKASVRSFGQDAFAPFSVDGWMASQWAFYGECLDWPTPSRSEPMIADVTAFAAIPTLILSGDIDMNAQTEIVRGLTPLFPRSTFMVVAGAGHVAANPWWGDCAGGAVNRFLDTLTADPNACASI